MPRKSTPALTDEERALRIREAARDAEASNSAKDFERAFRKVIKRITPKSSSPSGT